MASLADLFASTTAPNANDLRMQAVAPVKEKRANPYGEGNSFSQVVGKIGDILAALGGNEPVYLNSIQAKEKRARQQQQEEALSRVGADPANAEARRNYLAAGGDVQALQALTPKPQNEGTLPREILIARMLADPNTPEPIRTRLEQLTAPKPAAPAKPLLRGIPGGGTAVLDPETLRPRVLIPGRAPAAPTGHKPPKPEKPLTQDESKTTGFYARARAAETILSDPTTTNPGVLARAAEDLPYGAGSSITKSGDQQSLNARKAFATAVLRKDSGATITADEWKNTNALYFPSPGDSEATIKQKAQNRAVALQALQVGAGRGADKVSDAAPPPAKPQSAMPTATGPNGQKVMWNGKAWVAAR